MYNTEKFKELGIPAPTGYLDLLNPKLKDRVMSIDLDTVKKANHIVLVSGGAHRAPAIRATIRRVGCNTLITDEGAAAALLQLAEAQAD